MRRQKPIPGRVVPVHSAGLLYEQRSEWKKAEMRGEKYGSKK